MSGDSWGKEAQPRRAFLSKLSTLPLAAVGGSALLSGCSDGQSSTKETVVDGAGRSSDTALSDTTLSDGERSTTGDGAGSDAAGSDAVTASDTSALDASGQGDGGSDAASVDSAIGSDGTSVGADGSADGAGTCSTAPQGQAPQPCVDTGADLEGPYFEANAPSSLVLAGPKEPGEPLLITGRVYDHGCAAAIANTQIEVWQADDKGKYRDLNHKTPLRATLLSDCSGKFSFTTILPGAYLDVGGYRPRHIHFRVTTPSKTILITQLYFAGDPYLSPNDSCGSCKSGDASHIVKLTSKGKPVSHSAHFDIVL